MNLLRQITLFHFMLLLPLLVVSRGSNAIDSLRIDVENAADGQKKADAIVRLSDALLHIEPAESMHYAEQAYQLSDEIGYDEGKVQACLILSQAHYFESALNEAMDYAIRAKNLAEDLDNELYYAKSLDAIGVIYYDIGNQAKSSESFFSSLKIYEKLGENNGIGADLCRIGTLYFDQQDYTKAEDYYLNSIKIAREINSQEGIASNLNNLAKVYSSKQEYEKALKTYQEALDINIKTGNVYLEASNYLNIAEVYFNMENYPSAIDKALLAKSLYQKLGNKVKLAKSQVLLSDIYLKTGQLEASKSNAAQALENGLGQGFKEVTADAAGMLYKIYLEKHDSASALRYFILAKQYEDSLLLADKQKTLTALDLKYKFDKSERDLVLARQRRNIAIMVISGCLIFSLIIIILILKQLRLRAKKMQLEKEAHYRELEFKNKEMVLNVMSLMKKNEMLAELSNKLVIMAKDATTDDSKDALKKAAREIQKSQENEIWKEFSTRFKEVHGEFYEKLLKRFPLLTPNELKLCAFLRLNMSSKEIAELTGQRISTLETARYRLRQKLGIANSDVNLVTFLSAL